MKTVIVVRHGDLFNPRNILYTVDSEMKKEDIMHLSGLGRRQIRALGRELTGRGYTPVRIITSPAVRTQESSGELARFFPVPVAIDGRLNEVFAPGIYHKLYLRSNPLYTHGILYDYDFFRQYNHEKPEQVAGRMRQAFWDACNTIGRNGAIILVSHGDPTCWLFHTLLDNNIPDVADLNKKYYMEKGCARVLETEKGSIINSYEIIPDVHTS